MTASATEPIGTASNVPGKARWESVPSLFRVPFFGKLLAAALVISMAAPGYLLWVVYPSFEAALIHITEQEAVRVGTYLAGMVTNEVSDIGPEVVAKAPISHHLRQSIAELGLFKLRIYSPRGEIVYSSDAQEIGDINEHDYFHQRVARGAILSALVEKGAESADGQRIALHVVETYVPIMREGRFLGALELYYDISDRKRDQEQRLLWTTLVLSLLALGSLGFLALAVYRAAQGYREQQCARATIAELNHRHELLLNSLAEGVFGVDRQGRFTFVNRTARRLLGIDADPIGRDCHKLIHHTGPSGQPYPPETCPVHRIMTTGKPLEDWNNELFWRVSGGSFPVEIFAAPIIEDGGVVQGAVIAFTDITERKRAEAALIEARLHAETANRAKSTFLANMSHELRTPLNAILGHAQILRRDPGLSAAHRKGAEAIQRSGDYLLALVNDILDLAKVEAGRFELVTGPCDLRALIASLDDLFEIRAHEKRIVFRCEIVGAFPAVVEADERRLRQILVNLLGNAVKFTERGEVRLRATFSGGVLNLEVSDTGIGIETAQLEELFKPFVQVGAREYRRQGAGLGLAIANSLVEQMGGRIEVDSNPGQGTRFRIALPLRTHEGGLAPTPTHQAGIGGYRRGDDRAEPFTILIVDDIVDNRMVLRLPLESLGFSIVEAGDGGEALTSARAHSPDLILMDLMMPGLDGLETTRRLKSDARLRGIPVIACSASAFTEDRNQAREAGCDDYLSKPVQLDDLYAVFARRLNLVWAWMEHEEAGATESGPRLAGPVTGLLAEQRADLLALARQGDITGLLKLLDTLPAELNKETRRLREMIKRFDFKGVRALLEKNV